MKKDSKLHVLPPEPQPSWSNTLEEHPFIQWASENGKMLLYGLLALFLFLIFFYRLIGGGSSANQADFVNAERDYLTFASSKEEPASQTSSLESLNKILSAHPELHPKYDGLIAETLLVRGKAKDAQSYAMAAINRTEDENQPFYTQYAQNTLTIANERYEEALKAATTMKQEMEQKGLELQSNPEKIPFGTLLYALNLLRIGMLQQQLNLKTEELATWQEWKTIVNKSREGSTPLYLDGQLFLTLDRLLAEGNASFSTYIQTREKLLKKV